MHGAETGGGVWGAKPTATRSVRNSRAEEGDVPENMSSEKPRVSNLGNKPRDVLPQTDIVASTTSERGGAVSRPIASIRKTCPATGVDPSLAGLLKNLLPLRSISPGKCASGERSSVGLPGIPDSAASSMHQRL
jgi:hypothetical protein